MHTSSRVLFVLLLAAALPTGGRGEVTTVEAGKPLEEGAVITSGKYSAKFEGGGFTIKAVDGGQTWTVRSLPPVYLAKWTQDSTVLATVEHIAGGTDSVLFHQAGGQWIRSDTTPGDGDYRSYKVSKWDVGESSVDITYNTTAAPKAEDAPSAPDAPTHQVTIKFNPKTLPLLTQGLTSYVWKPNAEGMAELAFPAVGPQAPSPIMRPGVLAIDTDGSGPSHGDPDQRHDFPAKLDKDGKLVPAYLKTGKTNPAGVSKVNADNISYGVAPKNLAGVNGGPIEVGAIEEVVCPNGTHKTIVADFGPVKKNGEVSYHAIKEFGYKIIEPTKYGPLPSTDGKSNQDIKVDVTYKPN